MIGSHLLTMLLACFMCLLSIPCKSVKAATYQIIAVQHQSMKPYDDAFKSFKENMESKGIHAEIIRYNAKNDLAALDVKIEELKHSKSFDLILALGTHSTIRLVKNVKTTPIIFTGLGDPENSGVIPKDKKGIPMWESSGANYTGVETPEYISMGIRAMHEIVKFKSIGMIYLSGSPSHEAAITQVKKLSGELKCDFFYHGFPLRDNQGKKFPKSLIRQNISDSLEKVLPKVEVFFVQISKAFDDNFDLFQEGFLKYRTFASGDPLYIKKGIVMGIGRDFKMFGGQCGDYAHRIFKGEKPSQLPMNSGNKISIELNLKAASLIGHDLPPDLMWVADKIYDSMETE